MPSGLDKVRRGDSLVIPAMAYNAFVDAALDHRARQRSQERNATKAQPQNGIVQIKNESGADRSRFDVLGINGPIIKRVENEGGFLSAIALRGVMPTTAHAGRFAVLLDALKANSIGRAYIAGACLARVRMIDEAHTAADVDDSQGGQLASGTSGTAALLWVEPINERANPPVAWALIRFGGGGGASGATLAYAKIESSIGTTPPFIYTARVVTPSGGGAFGAPSGTDFDLHNLAEIGAGGTGVHAVPAGSIVAYWQDAGTGDRYFDRSFYRGTF